MASKSASCHVEATLELRSPIPAIRFPDPSGRDLKAVLQDAAPGSVIELAPGRYRGPLVLDRPLTLKGAGDLTRIVVDAGPAVTIRPQGQDLVFLESLAIEAAEADDGAGLHVECGRVRLYNVHVRGGASKERAGGLWMQDGELEGSLVRFEQCAARLGGAIHAGGSSRLVLRDAQIRDCEADVGGGLWVGQQARVELLGATFTKVRARQPAGGQAAWVGESSGLGATLKMERVRFEDAPFGQPLVVQAEHPGRVVLFECDLPSEVLRNPGIVDGGNNRWR